MLALTMEQGRRGMDEASTIRQGRPAGQRVNIKEKISQWESWTQQSSSRDAVVSRTLSGDLLGNGYSNEGLGVRIHARDSRSRAKSTELDFRESPAHDVHSVAARKSELLKKSSTSFSNPSPGKNSTAKTFATCKFNTDTLSSANPVFSANGNPKLDRLPDILIVSKPLPPSAGDQDDNMPAGNFYTSRGFWRKLEGDRLLWENSRSNASDALPPPKPQRTFQYHGTSNNTKSCWNSRSPHNSSSFNLRSRRVVKPPNFPPPPCPVIQTEGLSRHKNRKSFEYEDATRLTAQQGTVGNREVHPDLYHAYSDDNIYEDIVCKLNSMH